VSGMIKTVRSTCVWVAALVSLAVLAAQNLSAQDLSKQDPSVQGQASHDAVLHIAVVSGEGAIHAPGEHVAKPVTVQVTDGTGRPVEGARVSFQVPLEGPGGVFSSGLGTDLAVTDASGRATVRSLQLNRTAGRCLMRVTAAKEQARAGIVLQQYISDPGSARDSADRTGSLVVPEKPALAVQPPAAAPQQPKSTSLEITPASPLPPKKAKEPKALTAMIQPSKSAVQPAEDTAPPKLARIPTIIITQGSGKPVPAAMISRGYTAQKSRSHKKWVWIGILAAGGVAGAFAGSSMATAAVHNSASAAALTAPVTIGTPTINLGKP
jgi:hypothetical protein